MSFLDSVSSCAFAMSGIFSPHTVRGASGCSATLDIDRAGACCLVRVGWDIDTGAVNAVVQVRPARATATAGGANFTIFGFADLREEFNGGQVAGEAIN